MINKNSFKLQPVHPISIPNKLIPNQTLELVIPCNTLGVHQPFLPVNMIQFAVKNNTGVYYFQALLPIDVLFTEEVCLTPKEWLSLWKETIPPANEFTTLVPLTANLPLQAYRDRLKAKNISFVAERVVESQVH